MTLAHDRAEAELLQKYAEAASLGIHERSGSIAVDMRAMHAEVKEYSDAWAVPMPDADIWAPYLDEEETDG